MEMTARKSLGAEALVNIVYRLFKKIQDPQPSSRSTSISFTDILMSGLAVFGLKFPSLLKYDQQRNILDNNLKTLYHIHSPPSDTYLRERLDELDPSFIRPAFKKLFAAFQRGKGLEQFVFFQGHYILAVDGTGEFSSGNVCCDQCCKKEHKDGSVTYYHQMLGGCLVHPEQSNVIPLCPEVILNRDGSQKNDCERNATKRFIEHFRREHPHLKVIITGDGLSSNAPNIQVLEENQMKYFLVAKPGDHQFLFNLAHESENAVDYEVTDKKGFLHQFRYVNGISLNKSHPEMLVNFLEYMQTDPKGKEILFSWVTNIEITQDNVMALMQGGRARWKIENETFNTLKNLGYNLEHNYGHGKKYLSSLLCLLTMLAFLIDQIQEVSCSLYQAAKKRACGYKTLWEYLRVFFQFVPIPSWEWLYTTLATKKYLNSS